VRSQVPFPTQQKNKNIKIKSGYTVLPDSAAGVNGKKKVVQKSKVWEVMVLLIF
jgi:hypothetical protein